MAEPLPQGLAWWDGRKAALMKQIQDNLGGSVLDALRGVAHSGIDLVDQGAGAMAGLASGGRLGPTGVADKLLPPTGTPAEGVGEFLGPPLKTAAKLATFGGVLAKHAPLANLERGLQMTKEGQNVESVWKQTGAWVGPDKRTRFEIPDQKAALRYPEWLGGTGKAADLLEHSDLWTQYPHLADIQVAVKPGPVVKGSWNRKGNSIVIEGPPGTQKDTFLHELQHAIQEHEGFTPGTSPKAWQLVMEKSPELWQGSMEKKAALLRSAGNEEDAKHVEQLMAMGLSADPVTREKAANRAYKWMGGEIESRNVEKRSWNSASQNQIQSPAATADVPMSVWLTQHLSLPETVPGR